MGVLFQPFPRFVPPLRSSSPPPPSLCLLSYPISLKSPHYSRNRFTFNLSFLCLDSDVDHWHPILERIGEVVEEAEMEEGWVFKGLGLSTTTSNPTTTYPQESPKPSPSLFSRSYKCTTPTLPEFLPLLFRAMNPPHNTLLTCVIGSSLISITPPTGRGVIIDVERRIVSTPCS